MTRRGLAGMLRAAATGVDGITSATVQVRRRRARVTAASGARGRPAASGPDRARHPGAPRPPGRPGPAAPTAADSARRPGGPLMHADRTNRVVLTLFGLLVLAAGAAAMAASTGVFGAAFSRRTLLANRVSSYFGHHGGWLWPAIAGACLLLALACLRWMLALLASTDRAGDITIRGSTDQGTTILRPAALIDALTSEISTYHGVDTAKGRVIGDGRDPEIVLTVITGPAADLHALHHRIETEAFAHARQALGNPSLPIQLDLVLGRPWQRLGPVCQREAWHQPLADKACTSRSLLAPTSRPPTPATTPGGAASTVAFQTYAADGRGPVRVATARYRYSPKQGSWRGPGRGPMPPEIPGSCVRSWHAT